MTARTVPEHEPGAPLSASQNAGYTDDRQLLSACTRAAIVRVIRRSTPRRARGSSILRITPGGGHFARSPRSAARSWSRGVRRPASRPVVVNRGGWRSTLRGGIQRSCRASRRPQPTLVPSTTSAAISGSPSGSTAASCGMFVQVVPSVEVHSEDPSPTSNSSEGVAVTATSRSSGPPTKASSGTRVHVTPSADVHAAGPPFHSDGPASVVVPTATQPGPPATTAWRPGVGSCRASGFGEITSVSRGRPAEPNSLSSR